MLGIGMQETSVKLPSVTLVWQAFECVGYHWGGSPTRRSLKEASGLPKSW